MPAFAQVALDSNQTPLSKPLITGIDTHMEHELEQRPNDLKVLQLAEG